MNNDIYCNNCGKNGHLYHQCKLPITSIGIVAFRIKDQIPEYLMIRRKDSFGYIDFMRGKYSPYNINQIQNRTIFTFFSINPKSMSTIIRKVYRKI